MNPSKKIKVAFVRQKYTDFGGAEKFLHLTMQLLSRDFDAEVTLITRRWKPKENYNNKINIKICDPFYIGRLWRDWGFGKEACRLIKKEHYDIVQSHERISCGNIYRAGDGVHKEWLKQRSRSKTILQKMLIKLSPYHNYLLLREKKVFLSPDLKAIITNSKKIANEIESNFPGRVAKIHTIPNAVDQKIYSPSLKARYSLFIRRKLSIPVSAHVSLFVGSGYERKGVNQLLNIFKKLDNNYHLLIIGKEKSIGKYKKCSQEIGVSDRVHFLGPQKDIKPFLGAANLFLFPSLYDPLPNSTLEAAAAGIPVLASLTTGAADLTEQLTEKPLDPYDIDAWVSLIKEVKKNGARIHDMENYTEKNMISKLTELYKQILTLS